MKYLSLDIETTGLDFARNQIIQIAGVVDDLVSPIESLPKFNTFIRHDVLSFQEGALSLHMESGLLEKYMADERKPSLHNAFEDFRNFLIQHYLGENGKDRINVAGKNVAGFDLRFIREQCPNMAPANWFLNKLRFRTIDPAVYFTDFFSDEATCGLEACKERAGIKGKVTHDALEDCFDIINCVRYIANENKGRWRNE